MLPEPSTLLTRNVPAILLSASGEMDSGDVGAPNGPAVERSKVLSPLASRAEGREVDASGMRPINLLHKPMVPVPIPGAAPAHQAIDVSGAVVDCLPTPNAERFRSENRP